MIRTFDIKSHWPTVEEALGELEEIIRMNRNREVVIKIIHGYGSTGEGGKIRQGVMAYLQRKANLKQIAGFIPGNAFQHPMGFVNLISQYRKYLKDDSDFNRDNDGITYILLKRI
jgi:hypothetical protein